MAENTSSGRFGNIASSSLQWLEAFRTFEVRSRTGRIFFTMAHLPHAICGKLPLLLADLHDVEDVAVDPFS